GDVADLPLTRKTMAGCAGCFHLAAVASVQRGNEDWLGTHRANQTASIAVFEAARTAGDGRPVPVVYASSAAVYGDNPALQLKETAETRPLSAYGADKLGTELHARVASLVHGVPTVGLRFFNVYGPRQDPASPYSGVIAIFAGLLAAGRPIAVHGDGRQSRDFIYVGDVVRYLLAAMALKPAKPQVFNVCTGRVTSILELARAIGQVSGKQPEIAHEAARAGDIRASLGDPGRLNATFGFAAGTTLSEGLARTLT
ncbi:MAG: NAD-dependent epimerase/dehydratase family protein, partial [Alphaproteobacteria bacterium]|nr:NAD-dependent epimerase/dehydratase family protein [Alphaproteobacteria bacterium]